MEYIVVPNRVEDIQEYLSRGIHSFIVGLKDYTVNYPSASFKEIEELSTQCSLWVAINKNIFNHELADIQEKLIQLSRLSISGVLFYDLGILNLVLENNIPISLCWHQTHMVTNYNTCNYYYEKNVEYGFVANEITLEEILEINKNTKMKLMVEVFGYPIMSHSRRNLLSNYLKSIGKKKEERLYHLEEKDEKYLIKETKDGASLLYGRLTNGVRSLFSLISNGVTYGVLDMQEVDSSLGFKILEDYVYILENYDKISDIQKQNVISHVDSLIGSNTNFFYKKTIFKVKKEDFHDRV